MARLTFNPNIKSSTAITQESGAELGVVWMNVVSGSGVLTKRNLEVLDGIVKYELVGALLWIGIDLLARSVPRAPVDTGELRESGLVMLESTGGRGTDKEVASGNADGSITVKRQKADKRWLGTEIRFFDIEVSYYRMSRRPSGEFDVALFTHEYLYPQDQRPTRKDYKEKYKERGFKFARVPNTGPKYLEIPWNENRKFYESVLREAVLDRPQKRLNSIKRVLKRGDGKNTIDIVELVHSKIEAGGFIKAGPGVGVR